jgi:SAM-dependent methyltransferase
LSFFNSAYRGTPPWDIGRPQREFIKLADEGKISGDVVDLGCGTGENAMMFASRGNRVLGVDAAPLAIEKAKAKAQDRGSRAEFLVADALDLRSLGRTFDVATDCGLFHTFSDGERKKFVRSLGDITRTGGSYFMLCFSDEEPADWGGPRRIKKEEITRTFSSGWKVDWIKPARFEAMHLGEGGHAWLARVTRVGR